MPVHGGACVQASQVGHVGTAAVGCVGTAAAAVCHSIAAVAAAVVHTPRWRSLEQTMPLVRSEGQCHLLEVISGAAA